MQLILENYYYLNELQIAVSLKSQNKEKTFYSGKMAIVA